MAPVTVINLGVQIFRLPLCHLCPTFITSLVNYSLGLFNDLRFRHVLDIYAEHVL